MSIRWRLFISHTTMLIVTLVLFLISALLIPVAITGDIRSIKDLYTRQYALKPLTKPEENVFLDVKYLAKKQPNQLLNQTMLKQYDQKLDSVTSGLIVRKGDKIVHSSKILNSIKDEKKLPPFEPENIKVRDTISIDHQFFLYVKFDFYFPNQEKGSVIIMREVSPFVELSRSLFPLIFGLLFLSLILVNGLLSYFVSKSIIKPLFSLKNATEQMGEGNLNVKIEYDRQDEIGQLNHAFDKMRTKLKESIKLQLQYEESRKELISNISHDLKTPITAIKGYIEGIQDGVAESQGKTERYLSTIKRKATDMDQLIDDLFLFSKLDLKKMPFSFEDIEIIRYIINFVEEIGFDLEEKDIKIFVKNRTENEVRVIADRDKLRRVLSNIINNSIKHMKKAEKQIEIYIQGKGDFVEIEVRDNGSGIEQESLPYIFERFYRVDTSRNKSTGGSGLGLAIAKQIITEHGGDIWVESKLGIGTSIFFTLKKTI
ncbi:HAMP domain-containing histidine kinase [Bacillus salipaludis]|uniref:histidine kinase n=1 Tax=Bacillus salipaludis TaxID=2547811 RepID=A0A4R5VW43_9BACI|nr:HAMP domain-containing sensor histidine kinase [Bacillus salipaludis]MDQ6600099.1 HAMP domain-containing sensor histidine kinase [Bacillus salipaludis]TDK62434.1 HAMP domain-containing histidine kinase [Bacillus salipaludis]